ncbi:VOC family protein [Micromonospora sp. NPDC000089]|uniref:VOC family protein n=1 Tax=unclassified Micromonospora TaxID=2617518 RepID=UPI0036B8BE93
MAMHARVVADDFPRTVRFYAGLLGADPERLVPEFEYASFDQGGETVLAILGRRAAEAAVPVGTGGGVMLVLPVSDVDELVAGQPADAVVAAPADRPGWGVRSAYLRDPEGNLVEVQTWQAGG